MKKFLFSVLALSMMTCAFANDLIVRNAADTKSFRSVMNRLAPVNAMTPNVNKAQTDALTFSKGEFAYYPSMSSAGNYNYSVNLYNIDSEGKAVPAVMFDIYTTELKKFEGVYQTASQYCYYIWGSIEAGEYAQITKMMLKITKSGTTYSFKGSFTADQAYTFTATIDEKDMDVYDAEHVYEPETATTVDMSADINDGRIGFKAYPAYSYSLGAIELDTPADTLSLMFLFDDATLTDFPDGTYGFITGQTLETGVLQGFFSEEDGYPVYSILYSNTEMGIFYLVDGTVVVKREAKGIRVTIDAKSFYGSSIKADYVIGGDDPQAIENAAVDTKATKIIRDGQIFILRDGKMYNAVGAEVK